MWPSTPYPTFHQEPGREFLWKVHVVTLGVKVRSCKIRKALNASPHFLRIEGPQFLAMLGRPCVGMLHEKRKIRLATPTVKLPRCRPVTRWNNYISNVAGSSHGVKPAELSEIAVDRVVFPAHLGLRPCDPPQTNVDTKMKWKKWTITPVVLHRICHSRLKSLHNRLVHLKTLRDWLTWQECSRDISCQIELEVLLPPLHCMIWVYSLKKTNNA